MFYFYADGAAKKLADKKLCKCSSIWHSLPQRCCDSFHYYEPFIDDRDFAIQFDFICKSSWWIKFPGNHNVELSSTRRTFGGKSAITIFKWSKLIFHGKNSLVRSWILYFPLCGRQRVDRSAIILKKSLLQLDTFAITIFLFNVDRWSGSDNEHENGVDLPCICIAPSTEATVTHTKIYYFAITQSLSEILCCVAQLFTRRPYRGVGDVN